MFLIKRKRKKEREFHCDKITIVTRLINDRVNNLLFVKFWAQRR